MKDSFADKPDELRAVYLIALMSVFHLHFGEYLHTRSD